jgi:hypothetical protein
MNYTKIVKVIGLIAVLLIAFHTALYFSSYDELYEKNKVKNWSIYHALNKTELAEKPIYWLPNIQYDHIAITENFQKNQATLFQPKTYVLDPKGGKGKQLMDGTCEARFPIMSYLIAKNSHDLPSQLVLWRVYSLIFFLLSVAAIYSLIQLLSENTLLSCVGSLGFGFTSVALYTQNAIGTYTMTYFLMLSSIYFLIHYFLKANKYSFWIHIILASIAASTGHGSVILLLLSFVFMCFDIFKNKTKITEKLIPFGLFAFGFGLFIYHRMFLYNLNGGIFELNGVLNGGIKGILKANAKLIFFHSYNILNTFLGVFSFVTISGLVYIKYYKKESTKIDLQVLNFSLFYAICNGFYYLMYLTGFSSNDYYFLEFMIPSIVLLACIGLVFLEKLNLLKHKLCYALIFLVLGISLASTIKSFSNRFSIFKEYEVHNTIKNLTKAESFLLENGIEKDEKISLLNGYLDNMALMLCNRKGYVSNGSKTTDFVELINHSDSKYILSQDQFFMFDIVNEYPEILSQIKLIASNKTLSIYEKRNTKNGLSDNLLIDYAKCQKIDSFKIFHQDFERLKYNDDTLGVWNITDRVMTDSGYKSKTCIKLASDQDFPCTYNIEVSKLGFKPKGIAISGMFYSEREFRKICIVTSIHEKPDFIQYFFEPYYISKKLKNDALNKWTKVSCNLNLPENTKNDDLIKVYLWNPNKGELIVDDFSFIIY